MLKLCPNKIALPLQIIFNNSLQQTKYPTNWKLAHMLLQYLKRVILHCRLITDLYHLCVGKIMERVIYKHVYNHLHQNRLMYEYQSGFLPRHSTVHKLLEIYNNILNSLENKEANCFVFYDFSKAFDKVWHRGLLHKMKAYGITGNLINWFNSYLKSRRQKVVIKNNSAYCELSAGVPQGSVLDPLLFIIYINDIADKLISLSRLFADDTLFGYSNQDIMQLTNVY